MKKKLMFLMVVTIVAMATLFVSCTEEPPAPELFTVTFDSNGGSAVASQQVERGKCAQQPKDPVKDGYEFVNWNLDGKAYDFAAPVTKSITLKAVWKAEVKPEPTPEPEPTPDPEPEPVPEPKFVLDAEVDEKLLTALAGTDKGYNTNKGEKNSTYTVAQFKELVEGYEFYVELGATTYESVDSLKLGDTLFEADDLVTVSMGNSRYVKDKAYYVEGGKLYAAAPVVLVEISENIALEVNGDKYEIEGAELPPDTNVLEAFWNGGTNDVAVDRDVYTAIFNDETATHFLAFEFGVDADHYLTKKTYYQGNGVIGASYGYTAADVVDGRHVLGFYPLGWSSTGLPEVGYDAIGYFVCMLNSEGDLYTKRLLVEIEIPEFVATETIPEDIASNMLLIDTGYNITGGESGRRYTAEEFKVLAPGFEFYTELGKVRDDVTELTVGDTLFEADDLVTVSMGNNRFVEDNAFKVVDDKLYAATPILGFELFNNPELIVSGNAWDIPVQFESEVIQDAALTEVKWQSGSTNEVHLDEVDGVANVTFKVNDGASNKWLELLFEPQNTWYLTQKTYVDEAGKIIGETYGYTRSDKSGENNVLAFYPLSYSNTEVKPQTWSKLDYKVVFADGDGVAYGKLLLISALES